MTKQCAGNLRFLGPLHDVEGDGPALVRLYRQRRRYRQVHRPGIRIPRTAWLMKEALIDSRKALGRRSLWLPFNLKRDGRAPAVVLPHGGPVGHTIDDFNRTAAALSSRGYVCIAPNVRGSTGYGRAFQRANVKDLGGGDLQDEVYATKFLVATGYVDIKRIGIAGGSYGGYMTLMALAKTPSVWAAGVDSYGIVNWFTTLQNEDAFLQEYDKALLGDPIQDRKLYEAQSPITFIKQIKAPLLVLHGDNDIRVPKEESEQVVALIQAQNGTVEPHYYANEGHGFSKRENQIDALERTVSWLDRYLKGDPHRAQ
jgi:dipeptidyl aminopeptidase/acylaminoacyl peptidase